MHLLRRTLALTLCVTSTAFAVPQRALVNLSTRLQVGTGTSAPIANFQVEGTAPKTVLVRVVGPSLAAFGITGALADPTLTIYDGAGLVAGTNDNWGGTQTLKNAFAAVGAFNLTSDTSRDAALLVTVNPGIYSVHVTGVGNTTGVALVEVYDTEATPRLSYLALQGQVGTGASSLLVGFVVSGTASQSVLIRALGPELTNSGFAGALANPLLTVSRGATVVGTNDNWGGATDVSSAAATAGLWALPAGSNDAGLVLTLTPGSYTVQVTGVNNTTGLALVEIAQIDNDRAAAFPPMFREPPPFRTPASLASQTVTAGTDVLIEMPEYLAKPYSVTHQWRKNGAAIAGATRTELALPRVQTGDAGSYTVALTNSAGTTVSAPAVLTVNAAPVVPPPRLLLLSTLTTVTATDPVALSFTIEGTAAKPVVLRAVGPALAALGVTGAITDPLLSLYDGSGTKIFENDNWGGTSELKAAFAALGMFTLPDASKDAALLVTLNPGTYSAALTGVGGATGFALLEVQDYDQAVTASRIVYLATRNQVTSSVSPGFVIGGAGTGGNLSFLVRGLGPALSTAGLARALADPNVALFSGTTQLAANDNWGSATPPVTDAIAATGLTPFAAGSADSALLQTASFGTYSVRLGGAPNTSGLGMVEIAQTDPARAASFAPALLIPPSPVSVLAGATTTLSALAIGKPVPTYQWRKNGAALPNATASALTLANFQPGDAGSYSVVLTNSAGTTTSANYVVSLNTVAAPAILGPPTTQVVAAGATATFAVTATGNPAPTYQWLRNGVAVPGATASTLVIANVQAAQTGTYTVRLTNSQGTVTSAGADLIIALPPRIATPPAAQTVAAGNSVTLSVVATGTPPLTYQWRRDGNPLPGATGASFTIPAAQLNDNGAYHVTVGNAAGTVDSATAVVTVTRNFAGTYFGTFDGGRGNWSLLVRSDGTGTYVAFVNNPRGGIVATVIVAADGSFRTTSVLQQPQIVTQTVGGRPVAAANTPFILTGVIGATSVSGALEGLGVTYTGTPDTPNGQTAAVSGVYQSGNASTTTYTVVGTSNRVLALTVGTTSVDGGLGTVGGNGTFTVTTGDNTQVTGAVAPSSGVITTTVTPATGTAVTTTGSATTGLGPPVIASSPASRSVTGGTALTLAVVASGKSPLSYQWRKNGVIVPAATSAGLAIASVQLDDAGNYTCVVTNGEGTATTSVAGLTVVMPGAVFPAARLVNLSIRTDVRTTGDNFTLGYVVGGDGTAGPKPFVIRAAGPSLGALGVPGTLDDPKLELFAGATKTGENDNWGGTPELAAAFTGVGAFGFASPASRDAAALVSIATAQNSVRVSAAGNGTGEVIAELYDAASAEAAAPRLVNVSVLKHLGTRLTAGFVIGGSGSKTVLIRAVGPTLAGAPFNVQGVVADPQLSVFSGSTVIQSNDNWGGTPELTAAFTAVGAFALPANSRDAALLATLQPGPYTVQVSGVGNTTGVAIVEVYEVP